MVFAASRVRFAGSSFTAQQAQFLTSAVRRGLSRTATREVFRSSFSRGFSNEAFAAVRATLTQSELAGARLLQRDPFTRLRAREIPGIEVVRRSSRFVVTGTVRTRISSTGAELTRIIRFGTDESPTADMFNRRAKQIIDKGIERGESDMEIVGVTNLRIVEQVELSA